MDNKQKNKLDVFLVDTFKGLIEFILSILGIFLISFLPIILIMVGFAYIISKNWLIGLGCLILSVVSFYAARGLTEILKQK